jgi:hypothetical protein
MGKARGKTSKGADGSRPRPPTSGTSSAGSKHFKNFEITVGGKPMSLPTLPEKLIAPIRLTYAIHSLRGQSIEPATALWLADALEKAIQNPAKAGEAFSLKRERGRPKTQDDGRHLLMAIEVDKLLADGLPLTDTGKGKSAISTVAVKFHASVEAVELAWYTSRKFVDLMKAIEAMEVGAATFSDK